MSTATPVSCSECGTENARAARFCRQCGAQLRVRCTCGAVLGANDNFCSACGRITSRQEAPAPENRKKLEHPADRRPLTVVFCDLVGWTKLGQRLAPEVLGALLKRYQQVCKQAVDLHEGYVAQYLGDGVLIYFGYPLSHEDDADRAINAALAIQVGLDGMGRDQAPNAPKIAARIGIHTGPVLMSEVGDGSRVQTLAVGDTINVAARLQGSARAGGVVISEETLQILRSTFVTRSLGTQELKGVEQPVRVHEVETQRAGR